MGIIQIICFVSDTLSDDQKSKFNFSSTYTQGLRASLGQGYYINSDCLLNNTAFFIVLASEWQGLIIRFGFQAYYLIASWFSSGAWSVKHFQNSTFFLSFNQKLTGTPCNNFSKKNLDTLGSCSVHIKLGRPHKRLTIGYYTFLFNMLLLAEPVLSSKALSKQNVIQYIDFLYTRWKL